jgi:ribosomal protein S18 acetylase RimI-like enzyme
MLRRERTLGLDTESRPSFRRGEFHPISLVQIASHSHAFLFQVRPGAPFRSLKRIVENAAVRKIVQGAAEEARELRRDLGIEARGFVDLPTVARAAGYTELNLRALAAAALGIRISKAAQRSDWSRPDLSDGQLLYAATDAWACLAVHDKIGSRVESPATSRRGADGLVIRRATESDADAVVALVRELAAGMSESTPLGAPGARAYLSNPACAVFVGERGGRVLGMASLSVRPSLYHGRDCGLVEELVVTAEERGLGLGRALLEAAVREAERRGCAEVSVSTLPGNAAALSLYRSAGLTDEAVLLEKHFESRRGRRRSRGPRRARA